MGEFPQNGVDKHALFLENLVSIPCLMDDEKMEQVG